MIVELIGAGIVLLSAMFVSAGMIRDYKNDLRLLGALYDMILYIRDNIEHFMKPLPDIFQNYSNEHLETCGFLKSVRETDLQQAWTERPWQLNREADSVMLDFVQTIGSGYRAEELRLCEYTLERLRGILEKSRTESAGKIKLYRTVPVLFALSVILILI